MKAFVRSLAGEVEFDFPIPCQLLSISAFDDHPKAIAPIRMTINALQNPIGTDLLSERLKPGSTIAVLIEDLTRNSPKKHLLRALLEELERTGIADDRISIVIALGTHRALSKEELADGYDSDLVSRYRFINHDCQAPDLVEIASLPTGTPVKINRLVHEADFRVGIGSIFPHPLNGFGGGCKILFPGVADMDSILEHHLKQSFVGRSFLGNLDGNRFHQLVNELALSGGLDFIINSVLDHNDRLYEIVCGDPVKAHIEGTKICRRIVSRSFKEPADLTIISTFPYSEGPQMMKPLAPAAMITRKGGTIVLVADCTVPLPELYLRTCEQFRKAHGNRLAETLLNAFADNRPVIENAPPELNMSLAQVMLALNDYKVIMVTRDMNEESVKRLGFIYADNIENAIHKSAEFLTNPTVHVVPSGGVILPVVG